MLDTAKGAIKRLLYAVGVLSLYHRLRNRHVLTVAMFHRVLSPADPRWDGALPTWTLSVDVFDKCLKFFRRHYTVVGLSDLLAALNGERRLPPHSLLLTFDDGYADNEEYALPLLRRYGLPAVVFVISDAVGRKGRPWTEDFLSAYLEGRITTEEVASIRKVLEPDIPPAANDTLAQVWQIMRGGPQLSRCEVQAAVSQLREPLASVSEPAQMLSGAQVQALVRHGVAIGAHGKTHTAFTAARDLATELREPRHVLEPLVAAEAQDAVDALSFPHGAYTQDIVARAFQEGYRLVFTGREELSPVTREYFTTPVIGRINVAGPAIAPRRRLRPGLLAFHFFCRPHARPGAIA